MRKWPTSADITVPPPRCGEGSTVLTERPPPWPLNQLLGGQPQSRQRYLIALISFQIAMFSFDLAACR